MTINISKLELFWYFSGLILVWIIDNFWHEIGKKCVNKNCMIFVYWYNICVFTFVFCNNIWNCFKITYVFLLLYEFCKHKNGMKFVYWYNICIKVICTFVWYNIDTIIYDETEKYAIQKVSEQKLLSPGSKRTVGRPQLVNGLLMWNSRGLRLRAVHVVGRNTIGRHVQITLLEKNIIYFYFDLVVLLWQTHVLIYFVF